MNGNRKYRILYPTMEKAIRSKGTIQKFLEATELSENAYYKVITGMVAPRKTTIDRILSYTGLTYEEAFYE